MNSFCKTIWVYSAKNWQSFAH